MNILKNYIKNFLILNEVKNNKTIAFHLTKSYNSYEYFKNGIETNVSKAMGLKQGAGFYLFNYEGFILFKNQSMFKEVIVVEVDLNSNSFKPDLEYAAVDYMRYVKETKSLPYKISSLDDEECYIKIKKSQFDGDLKIVSKNKSGGITSVASENTRETGDANFRDAYMKIFSEVENIEEKNKFENYFRNNNPMVFKYVGNETGLKGSSEIRLLRIMDLDQNIIHEW